ncbi:ABC transporter permease [Deinococcus metallilatus]|uniref:ABC transporter permease n=1 Tax=Deinococcus metallilatus TaxID=1211322 RepID=A0AAJ5F3L8_9DEIO|nr:ABC transporter permease [Deinococcus metallilatus]MBB5296309.1 peptide/nickel transport system permease protein [Deinococcus metallilatus]QBY10007.1 ABC transporter permease [Deinococcus metallilatus]RXJ08731.1 ABC transporter permease [Deinococcus metallilatus]TLK25205.1 ABC transporter permease [Deinococcus metallilatus]GMA14779.1 peptide ABC transporter permease [Deinococcus metallilatus]
MLNFIIRRLLQIPLVMLVLSILIVALTMLLTPAQRAAGYIRSEQQAAQLERIIRDRGLDQPFPVQYGKWLSSTLHGDLGFSKASGQPVLDTIKARLPNTIELSLVTAIPIILLGVWLGTLSALHKDKFLDQVLRVFAVLGYSLPSFVLGIVLLAVFYGYLGWLPGAGQLEVINQFSVGDLKRYTGMLGIDALLNGRFDIALDVFRHLVLPALTLIIILSATILKVMRNSLLEALSSDYVRTARAKGLPDRTVNLKHARRNALLSVITLGGFLIIGLLGGSVITETIFAYPGVGQWVVQSAGQLDIPAVLGFALLSALVVVVVSTVTDILYGVVDPRVRFD